MFDENNINEFDLMMKSILDEGREEVPASVWEGVSAGLDKAARHKTVVLWWKRTAVGVAAAAAITTGVILNHHAPEQTLMPAAGDSGMIAVVEPAQEPASEEMESIAAEVIMVPDLVAEVRKASEPAEENIVRKEEETVIKTAGEAVKAATDISEATESEDVTEPEETKEYFPENWGEDVREKKGGVSIVLSGIASTNNEQSQNRIGPMKAPSVNPAPKKTGITETSTKSSYGIPVSFGAGVKIDFNERWSLGIGANYSLLARKFYGKYTKVNENGGIESSTSSDISNTQHFIGIPVNAYYNIVNKDKINLYAYAGGTVEKCISDNYHVLSTSIFHKENVSGVQLSANAGIGVEFMMGDHLGLYIDPSLRYYFDCGQPKSIRTVQPLMFGFEMGFRFRL